MFPHNIFQLLFSIIKCHYRHYRFCNRLTCSKFINQFSWGTAWNQRARCECTLRSLEISLVSVVLQRCVHAQPSKIDLWSPACTFTEWSSANSHLFFLPFFLVFVEAAARTGVLGGTGGVHQRWTKELEERVPPCPGGGKEDTEHPSCHWPVPGSCWSEHSYCWLHNRYCSQRCVCYEININRKLCLSHKVEAVCHCSVCRMSWQSINLLIWTRSFCNTSFIKNKKITHRPLNSCNWKWKSELLQMLSVLALNVRWCFMHISI